jgi:hypothetical protein
LPSIAAGRAVLRCDGRSTVRGITVHIQFRLGLG